MARVNVQCWQETYRGLMPDAVLDDSGSLADWERFWTTALTDHRHRENHVAVAERDGKQLTQLRRAGAFDGLAGIALGLFTGFNDYEDRGGS